MPKAYTDGACRISNPGLCSCAFVLYDDQYKEKYSVSVYLGPELHTNNYAEYKGLLTCLQVLYYMQLKGVDIYCDSKLVVQQSLGKWKVNEEALKPLASEAFGLIAAGGHRLHHIAGHNGDLGNERADALCNACLDAHMEEYYASIAKALA